jgi:DNA gyrase/topoisomerase IV subunit B
LIDYKQSVNEYSKNIKTLERQSDHIRKKPGMWIGYQDSRGFINMIREILQNGFDEIEKELSPANKLWVEY